MEQVSLTSENYGELFRTLSHKRRNGVLALNFEQRDMQLLFREGRIVGVFDPEADEVKEIASRLVASGCIMEKVESLVREAGINASQLYDLLVGKEYVSEEDFQRAKDSYRIDLLHSLEQLEQGFAEFKPKLVKADSRHAFSVFPAQLLLDVEELKTDRGRLQALFTNLSNVDVLIRETGEAAARISESERKILDAAEQGCRVQEILTSCLMSEHEAIESLLALYDQDFIEFVESAESEQVISVDGFEAGSQGAVQEDEESKAALDALAANLEDSTADGESEIDRADEQLATDAAVDVEEDIEQAEDSQEASIAPPLPTLGLRERVRAGSYHLLNPSARAYSILVCTSLYLVALAVFGTTYFEQWFVALREFTSK